MFMYTLCQVNPPPSKTGTCITKVRKIITATYNVSASSPSAATK